MRKFILGTIAVLVLIGAIAAGIVLSGNTMTVLGMLAGPPKVWDEAKLAPAPDYAQASSWAAWPGRDDLADLTPTGTTAALGDAPVDVFFIHPTGYLNGASWNSPLNPDSRTEENTKWMMANQASAYNGVGRVYAPRYREASIFRYFSATEDIATRTMDVAYGDVVRSFEYFLANESRGRPFIIASHSQGSQHAFRLLQEKIDGTPLARRLVAAYVIGTRITNADAATLKSLPVCDAPTQTGCVVHWAAMGEGGSPPPDMSDLVCVNPLSWKRDGAKAAAELHRGAVPTSGSFSARMFGDDAAQGVTFPPLGAPLPAMTWAECKDGFLYVKDLADSVFAGLILPGKNYHGLDYSLFHMDIRHNVEQRLKAWMAANNPPASPEAPQE